MPGEHGNSFANGIESLTYWTAFHNGLVIEWLMSYFGRIAIHEFDARTSSPISRRRIIVSAADARAA
jgi:hypothetical protein